MFPHRRQPSSSPAPRRARVGRTARTSRSQPARRARLLTRRAKLNAARRPRRGVLLLVVLSLLVLFMMVGTAFIITAKQSQKTANAVMKSSARLASEAAQTQLLDEVLLQVLRDTNNPNSSLRFHSLLGDMYGNDGIKTRVIAGGATVAQDSTGTDVTRAQMLDLQLDQTYVKNFQNIDIDGYGNFYVPPVGTNPPPPRFSPYDNAYGGQVLTFLSGPAKGRSTRIVGFVPPNRIRVMNVQLENGALIDPVILTQIGNQQSRILINGQPFSGTGFGYNRAAAAGDPKLSLREEVGGTRWPLALLPNAKFLNVNSIYTSISATETPSSEHLVNGAGIAYLAANYTGPQLVSRRAELAAQFGPAGIGGANEGYDVADFQNMALAYVPATKLAETLLPGSTIAAPLPIALTIPSIGSLVIPSWHRPDLINYLGLQLPAGSTDLLQSTLGASPLLLRKAMLRPNWVDHPNFSGSNPELAAITGTSAAAMSQRLARMVYGPWDVDNDNDGIRDSVWIDVGLPVMAGPNGKLVKPLVAMLIVDQESKANINASGSCDLANAWDPATNPPGLTGLGDVAGAGTTLATGILSKATPRGVGYGPADVSLEWVVGPNDFRRLLVGDTINSQYVPGRYGHPDAISNLVRPGMGNTVDLLAQVQFFGWPRSANVRSNFGSPSDLRARYGSGVNYHGQPTFDATIDTEMTNTNASLLIDSPYEINLSQGTAAGMQGYGGINPRASDAIFADAELERVLRLYDADAGSLPTRLAVLSGLATDLSVRNKITTTSFDLPVPSISLPHEIADEPDMWSTDPQYPRRLPKSVAEIIEIRVRKGMNLPRFPRPLSPAQALSLREALRQLVAPELASGGRINVNRALGNGFDDNTNGVVDEPGEETASSRLIWDPARNALAAAAGFNAVFPGVVPQYVVSDATDPLNPVYAAGAPIDHRQLLARHLYVTALTMAAEADFDGTKPEDLELARRLAQWAVNVVDYRDPDNIMTPFEYDVNPFDGWDPAITGVPKATYAPTAMVQLVWGAERPELVMTETVAWHDRNTEDLTNEDPNPGEEANDTLGSKAGVPADLDFDQRFRPRGAFFLELYNPWPALTAPILDTHKSALDASNVEHDLGVDLAKTHDGVPTGSPVWRVIISRVVDPADLAKDPDDLQVANRPTIDRSVYFTTRDPQFSDDGVVSFYNHPSDPVVLPVRPGRYTVVGSGTEDPDNPGEFVSPLGQRLNVPGGQRTLNKLRRVVLDANNSAHSVRLFDNYRGPNAPQSLALNDQGAAAAAPYVMESPSEAEAANSIPELATTVVPPRNSIADVALINGAGTNERRRLTLSEPADGYPADNRNTGTDGVSFAPIPATLARDYPGEEGWYCLGGDPNQPKAIDMPLDDADPELRNLGTDVNRGRRIFLQRLANPLMPYHAATNPYLTIDDTRAYISVFNGRLDQNQREAGRDNRTDVRSGFASVERGEKASAQDIDRDLWSVRALDNATSVQDTERAGIKFEQEYSLPVIPRMTLGFLNRAYMRNAEADPVIKRTRPEQPFPWLTWNNRPYISGNELLSVPRHRSSRLLRYFQSAEKATGFQQYDPGDADNPQQQFATTSQPLKPFSHLENFFATEKGGATTQGVPLHLYRILDLVETPSLFAGTETWLNPANFNVTTASTTMNSPADPRAQLLAPFNRVSEFRDPGLINVNTVSERDSQHADKNVWDSMFHGRADRTATAGARVHPGPSLEDWVKSRRGYGAANAAPTLLNAKFPTVFSNPLRPSDAGDWVPVREMVRAGVDVTLLRSIDGKSGADVTAPTKPEPAGDPLFTTELIGAVNDHRNSERNGFFRYQPMIRLDNLTTSRSNVYAVWITVGFFEVEEAPAKANFATANGGIADPQLTELYNRVYPEGYAFAREDGVDVGNVRRLRGFYIIDRTKMAGFEPGADHNVEETIRLRRRIE